MPTGTLVILLKILNRFQHERFTVLESPKPSVAARAKQSSYAFPATCFSCATGMIVINNKALVRRRIATYGATILLPLYKLIILFNGQAVESPQSITQIC